MLNWIRSVFVFKGGFSKRAKIVAAGFSSLIILAIMFTNAIPANGRLDPNVETPNTVRTLREYDEYVKNNMKPEYHSPTYSTATRFDQVMLEKQKAVRNMLADDLVARTYRDNFIAALNAELPKLELKLGNQDGVTFEFIAEASKISSNNYFAMILEKANSYGLNNKTTLQFVIPFGCNGTCGVAYPSYYQSVAQVDLYQIFHGNVKNINGWWSAGTALHELIHVAQEKMAALGFDTPDMTSIRSSSLSNGITNPDGYQNRYYREFLVGEVSAHSAQIGLAGTTGVDLINKDTLTAVIKDNVEMSKATIELGRRLSEFVDAGGVDDQLQRVRSSRNGFSFEFVYYDQGKRASATIELNHLSPNVSNSELALALKSRAKAYIAQGQTFFDIAVDLLSKIQSRSGALVNAEVENVLKPIVKNGAATILSGTYDAAGNLTTPDPAMDAVAKAERSFMLPIDENKPPALPALRATLDVVPQTSIGKELVKTLNETTLNGNAVLITNAFVINSIVQKLGAQMDKFLANKGNIVAQEAIVNDILQEVTIETGVGVVFTSVATAGGQLGGYLAIAGGGMLAGMTAADASAMGYATMNPFGWGIAGMGALVLSVQWLEKMATDNVYRAQWVNNISAIVNNPKAIGSYALTPDFYNLKILGPQVPMSFALFGSNMITEYIRNTLHNLAYYNINTAQANLYPNYSSMTVGTNGIISFWSGENGTGGSSPIPTPNWRWESVTALNEDSSYTWSRALRDQFTRLAPDHYSLVLNAGKLQDYMNAYYAQEYNESLKGQLAKPVNSVQIFTMVMGYPPGRSQYDLSGSGTGRVFDNVQLVDVNGATHMVRVPAFSAPFTLEYNPDMSFVPFQFEYRNMNNAYSHSISGGFQFGPSPTAFSVPLLQLTPEAYAALSGSATEAPEKNPPPEIASVVDQISDEIINITVPRQNRIQTPDEDLKLLKELNKEKKLNEGSVLLGLARSEVLTTTSSSYSSRMAVAKTSLSPIIPGYSGSLAGGGNYQIPDYFSIQGGQSVTLGTLKMSLGTDGNLVLTGAGNKVLFTTNLPARPCSSSTCFAKFDSEGILSLTVYGSKYWTSSNGGRFMRLRTQPFLPYLSVVDHDNQLIWTPDAIMQYRPGELKIQSGTKVSSSVTDLYMQNDGNLVLYNKTGTPLWSSGTGGNVCTPSTCFAVFDAGGVLQIVVDGVEKYKSSTSSTSNMLTFSSVSPYMTITQTGLASPTSADCVFNETQLLNGQSITAFRYEQVASSQVCTSQVRTCTTGVLSGTYKFPTCKKLCAGCQIQ